MDDKRAIKRIPKGEIEKPQQDAEYRIRRHAAGLIRAFAELYPEEFQDLVDELKPVPRHGETLVKFDL